MVSEISPQVMLMLQVVGPCFGEQGLVHLKSTETKLCCSSHTRAEPGLVTLRPGFFPLLMYRNELQAELLLCR